MIKLKPSERDRVARGDHEFLKATLLKELEAQKEDLLVFKESKGLDDWIKGRCSVLQELLKLLGN